jgi:hypothetical protein
VLRFRVVGSWGKVNLSLSSPRHLVVQFHQCSAGQNDERGFNTNLSTKVILSAISATRFAILLAMIAYADVTPPPAEGLSPATEAALLGTGLAD